MNKKILTLLMDIYCVEVKRTTGKEINAIYERRRVRVTGKNLMMEHTFKPSEMAGVINTLRRRQTLRA